MRVNIFISNLGSPRYPHLCWRQSERRTNYCCHNVQICVHLWYEQRFGRVYRPLDCSMDALTTYAARTHAVAARLNNSGQLVLHAPFGLANLFGMRLVPNYSQMNPETYAEKAARMKALWPELDVVSWDESRL